MNVASGIPGIEIGGYKKRKAKGEVQLLDAGGGVVMSIAQPNQNVGLDEDMLEAQRADHLLAVEEIDELLADIRALKTKKAL